MFTIPYFRDLAERVVATFCEAWAALLIADGTGLLDAHWQTTLSVAGMAALITLLKGVGAAAHDPATGASALPSPGRHRRDGEAGAVRFDVGFFAAVVLAILVAWALIELFTRAF
ncbi:MAG TPA: holin [Nocardioidaceae bacterium]